MAHAGCARAPPPPPPPLREARWSSHTQKYSEPPVSARNAAVCTTNATLSPPPASPHPHQPPPPPPPPPRPARTSQRCGFWCLAMVRSRVNKQAGGACARRGVGGAAERSPKGHVLLAQRQEQGGLTRRQDVSPAAQSSRTTRDCKAHHRRHAAVHHRWAGSATTIWARGTSHSGGQRRTGVGHGDAGLARYCG